MPVPRLDPADLREFARRDWGLLDPADQLARANLDPDVKQRIASALYESAKATVPGWPTDADRWRDLAHHQRMREMLDRACPAGRAFGVSRVRR